MRFSLQHVMVAGGCALVILWAGVWYKLRNEVTYAHKLIEEITIERQNASRDFVAVPEATEPLVANRQQWAALQQKLKDTVAQVFAQITEFNWIEPYKTPVQNEALGTAFFINQSGELITNAHVIDQARVVFIQIPSLGKRRFEVDVIGVSPERDLALLKLKPNELENIKAGLGKQELPCLKFGDSDLVNRAEKLMALGYPLGQQGLKSTTGVVSGREHLAGQYFIQISAALNKGNSGGPSLNSTGEVIGVNSAIIQGAQNVGYIIPVNEVKLFLEQLRALPESKEPQLLRKPFLGVLFNNASETLTDFLKNPQPGGLYVVEVYKGSPLAKAGIQAGDMIYKINGYAIDIYGEMNVPWSKEDKISIIDYVSRLKLGETIRLEFYRKGVFKRTSFKFNYSELPPIRRRYPGYEKMDYQVLGGLVFMPLTLNHILLLAQFAPELMQYADVKKHMEPALILTHVQLNSVASRHKCLNPGAIISQINGERVKTLEDLRRVLPKSIETGFLTIKTTENVFVALPFEDIMQSEHRLAALYFYPLNETYYDLARRMNLPVSQQLPLV